MKDALRHPIKPQVTALIIEGTSEHQQDDIDNALNALAARRDPLGGTAVLIKMVQAAAMSCGPPADTGLLRMFQLALDAYIEAAKKCYHAAGMPAKAISIKNKIIFDDAGDDESVIGADVTHSSTKGTSFHSIASDDDEELAKRAPPIIDLDETGDQAGRERGDGHETPPATSDIDMREYMLVEDGTQPRTQDSLLPKAGSEEDRRRALQEQEKKEKAAMLRQQKHDDEARAAADAAAEAKAAADAQARKTASQAAAARQLNKKVGFPDDSPAEQLADLQADFERVDHRIHQLMDLREEAEQEATVLQIDEKIDDLYKRQTELKQMMDKLKRPAKKHKPADDSIEALYAAAAAKKQKPGDQQPGAAGTTTNITSIIHALRTGTTPPLRMPGLGELHSGTSAKELQTPTPPVASKKEREGTPTDDEILRLSLRVEALSQELKLKADRQHESLMNKIREQATSALDMANAKAEVTNEDRRTLGLSSTTSAKVAALHNLGCNSEADFTDMDDNGEMIISPKLVQKFTASPETTLEALYEYHDVPLAVQCSLRPQELSTRLLLVVNGLLRTDIAAEYTSLGSLKNWPFIVPAGRNGQLAIATTKLAYLNIREAILEASAVPSALIQQVSPVKLRDVIKKMKSTSEVTTLPDQVIATIFSGAYYGPQAIYEVLLYMAVDIYKANLTTALGLLNPVSLALVTKKQGPWTNYIATVRDILHRIVHDRSLPLAQWSSQLQVFLARLPDAGKPVGRFDHKKGIDDPPAEAPIEPERQQNATAPAHEGSSYRGRSKGKGKTGTKGTAPGWPSRDRQARDWQPRDSRYNDWNERWPKHGDTRPRG